VSFQRVAAPPPPPGPVDLDRVEAEAGQFAADGWVAGNVPGLVAELRAARAERDQLSRDASDARNQLGVARATVVRLDTELRAAREVVEAARGHRELAVLHGEGPVHSAGCPLCRAIHAYDRAVSQP
jgi:hypothetical protein